MIFIRKIIVSGYLLIALLLLAISYIIMHRNANCIKRYKKETTDLIGQLKHSVVQNESLTASRKKAVHAILHELRTPLTTITGPYWWIKRMSLNRYLCFNGTYSNSSNTFL